MGTSDAAGSERIPLWLDCDPGHDDAFAILFAAYHPSLRLLGISTVHGNASLARTTQNALSVLEAIGKPEVPVFPGAPKPFCRESIAAPTIHGESGLDGTDLLPTPTRSALTHCHAVLEMKDALLSCSPQTAWLIATGSLTNIGILFAIFPAVADHIRGLSVMGGSVGDGFSSAPLGPSFKDSNGKTRSRIGNISPYAEFNILCDPEAAQSVFSNPTLQPKTVLIPLDLTHQAFATHKVQKDLLDGIKQCGSKPTRLRKMFNELLMFFEHTYAEVFGLIDGPPLHDPLAVAVLLRDHVDRSKRIDFDDRGGERWKVDIDLRPEQLGRTKVTPVRDGVIIPRTVDIGKFWCILDACMERADERKQFEPAP